MMPFPDEDQIRQRQPCHRVLIVGGIAGGAGAAAGSGFRKGRAGCREFRLACAASQSSVMEVQS